MRSILRATAIALLVSVVSGAAQAQSAPLKFAYVNTQALMDVAPGRAAADSALQKTGEGFRAQLTKLQDSAQALLTKYQKEEPKLTAAAKDKYEKDLASIQTDLQAKNLQFQQQFEAKRNELYAPLTDAVKKALDDIRTEEGYAAIFANDPQTSVIVSADKNLDITDKVSSRLRATPALKAKASDTKASPTAPAGVVKPKPPAQ
jgi:outer membrane protein